MTAPLQFSVYATNMENTESVAYLEQLHKLQKKHAAEVERYSSLLSAGGLSVVRGTREENLDMVRMAIEILNRQIAFVEEKLTQARKIEAGIRASSQSFSFIFIL